MEQSASIVWILKGTKPKFSTFAPDKWTQMEYLNRVNEAYYNPVGKAYEVKPYGREVFRLNGQDNKGIIWEFMIKRKDGRNEFISAYPVIKNNGVN